MKFFIELKWRLFQRRKGWSTQTIIKQSGPFFKENRDYFDAIIEKDQHAQRERQRAEWEDWNPEELTYTSTAQNNEVDKSVLVISVRKPLFRAGLNFGPRTRFIISGEEKL